ncbi:transcription factor IIIC subunit delta N-term-domain-containing protein [Fomes fomentarius]|nr:transcription factor IIIC subunit delta N-term-domain-containing protein [Fomes fomentarius]
MAELPLPTVLTLAAVSAAPSTRCLQFSQDGQAILLTKHAVFILTPDTGACVELSSVFQQASDPKSSCATRPLGWLRTMVEFDRSLTHQWAADCADWGAVSLGSLDPSLQAVAPSPSNITADAGCVLALLDSNLDLTIWSAQKNPLTGQWIKLQDVTAALKSATIAKQSPATALEQTLRAQSTCIEWSSQPEWNLTPAPLLDASLLAVGNRAGSVTLLRFDKASRRMTALEEVSVSDRWVTSLAWSTWDLSQDGACKAMLSCATSDGSIVLLAVRQTLSSMPPFTHLAPNHDVSFTVQAHDESACDADGRNITGMRWANVRGRSPILMFHKPGILHLWSLPSVSSAWSGSRAFALRTQKRSVASSVLSPASGFCYVRCRDMAVISLSDGSFHVIHKLSTHPSTEPPPAEAIQSEILSASSRSVFVRAEPEKVSFKDVDRINGMVTYDGCSMFMWTYEANRPTDFSYKHDAKHVSTLVVARLWDEEEDEHVLSELAECVGRTKCGSGETPTSVLRPILLHLGDPNRLSRLQTRILDVLRQVPDNGANAAVVIPSYSDPGAWTGAVSRELRRSLTAHLLGWDSIQSQRIRYAVAAFCQKHAQTPDLHQQFGDAARSFLATIQIHVLVVLIRHLAAIARFLHGRPHDVFFAQRTIHQAATMPAIPPAIVQEAEELLARLTIAPPHPNAGHNPGDPAPASRDTSLCEPCPACSSPIPLDPSGADSAVCPRGHVWARCCITSLLLATPAVRTCVGCSRKALLPPSVSTAPNGPAAVAPTPLLGGGSLGDHDRVGDTQANPEQPSSASGGRASDDELRDAAEEGSFVQDLLEATRRCPVCGNNFVVLV